jgi:hypothetical protein
MASLKIKRIETKETTGVCPYFQPGEDGWSAGWGVTRLARKVGCDPAGLQLGCDPGGLHAGVSPGWSAGWVVTRVVCKVGCHPAGLQGGL